MVHAASGLVGLCGFGTHTDSKENGCAAKIVRVYVDELDYILLIINRKRIYHILLNVVTTFEIMMNDHEND